MKTAFLVVDIQNDFLPGGSLGVKNGHKVIPLINKLVKANFDLIIASKDWHPFDHGSFGETHSKQPGEKVILNNVEQILWPVHCVQNTQGAEFASTLDTTHFDEVFLKGTDKNIDSYSAFFDNGHQKSTGLGEFLKKEKITDVYVAGLTTDYCVKFSVFDAINYGFRCHVILDACRAVNLKPKDESTAVEEMRKAGAEITTTKEVLAKYKDGRS